MWVVSNLKQFINNHRYVARMDINDPYHDRKDAYPIDLIVQRLAHNLAEAVIRHMKHDELEEENTDNGYAFTTHRYVFTRQELEELLALKEEVGDE